MSRRQSLDRPGILSPPGPFLTPSPSPSVSASPRLQPSPSLSPFPQDVLLVTSNTITNTQQDQERKAATPGRRQSIHQISGSPNAGTVVFQPSPSQSPAAGTTVIGLAGNEFNTTLVGSNNISLNKKGNKRTAPYGGYGQATAVNSSGSFGTANVASSPKGQTKKATVLPTQIIQSQQQLYNHPASSPLHSDSPIASPSGLIKPPTPQPMIQQIPMVNASNHQLLQFIQNPQLLAAAAVAQQQQQQQAAAAAIAQQHQRNHILGTAPVQNSQNQPNVTTSTKSTKTPQQILPKPQSAVEKPKQINAHQNQPTISQSPQPQAVVTTPNAATNQTGQIILPTGNLNSQPILLNQINQMPMLVQQNTPQGVQLILRPPTPQLATPSLVIHNGRTQMQQPAQQQLLRIVNANGSMQLATTPTFIVSSQANLIQQTANLQTIKTNTQAGTAVTQLSGLHAALASAPRSQQFASINGHILGQGVTHLQNLQLNGNLAQIQMPNGLNGQIISQLPAQFQSFNQLNSNINLNQLSSTNLQQIAAAAAAAGATFTSPPPQQVGEIQMPTVVSAQNLQFSTNQHINITSPAVTPQPQLIQSGTPEPARNPTPVLQNVTIAASNGNVTNGTHPTAILVPSENLIHNTTQKTPSKQTYNQAKHNDSTPETKTKKTPKARRKKAAPVPIQTQTQHANGNNGLTLAVPTTETSTPPVQPKSPPFTKTLTSTGKLDLGNFMKLCGIEDDDYMDVDDPPVQPPTNHALQEIPIEHQQEELKGAKNEDFTITIPNQNSEVPYTFTIPSNHTEAQQSQAKHESRVTKNENANFVIKIDQNEAGQPYTISIPRLPTADEIQTQSAVQQTHAPRSTAPIINTTTYNNHPAPTIQSRINEIQNQLIGVNTSAPQTSQSFSTCSTVAAGSTVTTTTTAAVKPRRKPAAKKNGKKAEPATHNALITTSVGQVPSQIGNIQISQVDTTKATNQSLPMTNVVENKIQIMPILDSGGTMNKVNAHVQQQQSSGFHPQDNIGRSNDNQMQIQQQNHQHIQTQQQQTTPPNKHANQLTIHQHPQAPTVSFSQNSSLPQLQSSATSGTAAALISQLTGSLSLAFAEDGTKLLLRHDPNTPQDAQSHLILQAVLSGALPNVTIINDPSGEKPKQTIKSQPPKIVLPQATTIKQQPSSSNQNTEPQTGALPKRFPEPKKPEPAPIQQANNQQIVVSPNIQKLVTLPKIDSTQQLFCLNTITNQITQIAPGQTTTTLGSIERLLIAPTGINAQQLSLCMSQGQIHFDNPVPTSHSQQPPPRVQQQVVQPLQTVHQPKQVANVAPIIDQSKAKLEPKAKKAKPRKPKENLNKATVKPIQKLDLSSKPNTNPVQIVQPNVTKTTSSGSSMVVMGGKKLVGVTAPMQQQTQNQLRINSNQCNITNSNSNLSNTTTNSNITSSNNFVQGSTISNNSTASINATQPRLQPNNSQPVPPLVSVNSSQQTVTRVQTIHLTVQQQELLKSVQMHIQQLSAKLQNKNLLATLNIPADFDPNNPAYNKPLPALSFDLQKMTDADIYAALQRLFIEQQKILASGKLISGGLVPNGNFLPMMQQQNNDHQSFTIKPSSQNATVLKSEGQQIPANIVQPNNHNNTSTGNVNASTHRVHIYPMQHHQNIQQNKSVQLKLQAISTQVVIQPKPPPPLQESIKQQKDTKDVSVQKIQSHHQQFTNNKAPATSSFEVTKISSAGQHKVEQSSFSTTVQSMPAPITTQVQPGKTILPTSTVIQPISTPTSQAVFTAPLESPKPKIARPSLFQRQLEVDQQGCLKPDYVSPFQSTEEAVKRLIRYHCIYQNNEEPNSEEECEFEKAIIEFPEKFQNLATKYQQVLVQESMLQHRTSELCLINQLLVNDLQTDLLNMRTEAVNPPKSPSFEQQQIKKEFKTELEASQGRSAYSSNNSISSFQIKNEIKSEKSDKYGNVDRAYSTHSSTNDLKPEMIAANCQSYQSTFSAVKRDEHNGNYASNFDIESELTPSFIMKKQSAVTATCSTAQSGRAAAILPSSCALQGNFSNRQHSNADFSVDYFANSSTNGGYPLGQSITDALSATTDKKKSTDDTYDEWLCLPKDFVPNSNQNKSVDKHLNEIFESNTSPKDVESQLSDLFNNSAMTNGVGTSSVKDHMNLPEFFNSNSVVSKQVETRLDAMFGESPVIDKTDTQDMVESRLEELFSESSSPVSNTCNVMNTPQHFGSSHAPTSFAAVRRQQNLCMVNEYIEEQHQMTSSNPPRWIEPPEMMDAQFHEFMSANSTSNISVSGKRPWNGELFDHNDVTKKLCFGTKNGTDLVDSNMLDLHDSSTSAQDSLMHGIAHNAGGIVSDNSTAGFPHMMSIQHHQHQMMHHNHMQSQNVFDQAIMHVNHMANLSGSSGMSTNFEDDINRHVQNAIDSILNLQNSEGDSLNFSLDQSMGSFLGDGTLDQSSQHHVGGTIVQTPSNHCSLASLTAGLHANKRRTRMDDLSDCLISGAGDNSNMALDSPSSSGTGMNSSDHATNATGGVDFNCVTGIEEAVKSILSS